MGRLWACVDVDIPLGDCVVFREIKFSGWAKELRPRVIESGIELVVALWVRWIGEIPYICFMSTVLLLA